MFKALRFNPQLYASFKQLAAENGYTVTAALEKFIASALEFGLVFPAAKLKLPKHRHASCRLGKFFCQEKFDFAFFDQFTLG
jgi:hypothetical protein